MAMGVMLSYFSLGTSSKPNKSVNGTFNVLARVKTVLEVGFILAISIFFLWSARGFFNRVA